MRFPSQDLFLKPLSLNLFGNFSFRTGYIEMRCSKSCYLRDLELVDLFANEVIEQVYSIKIRLYCQLYPREDFKPE